MFVPSDLKAAMSNEGGMWPTSTKRIFVNNSYKSVL